ncbi:hypothetical protein RFI_26272, partial [Reticulomyxa filosa]
KINSIFFTHTHTHKRFESQSLNSFQFYDVTTPRLISFNLKENADMQQTIAIVKIFLLLKIGMIASHGVSTHKRNLVKKDYNNPQNFSFYSHLFEKKLLLNKISLHQLKNVSCICGTKTKGMETQLLKCEDPIQLINPFIVLKMGGEMIYILEHRLKAQKIVQDKSDRVLRDVTSSLFKSDFIDKLFTSYKVTNTKKLREMFESIAHSSIMQLDDSSMNKLFDLSLMGLKMQVLRSRDVYEMLECLFHHIDGVEQIVISNNITKDNDDVLKLINRTRQICLQNYTTLLPGLLQLIRRNILNFLQDKNIKVSMLLQQGIQSYNGHICIKTTGYLCRNASVPGLVFKYDPHSNQKVLSSQQLSLAAGVNLQEPLMINNITYTWEKGSFLSRLGENIGSQSRQMPGFSMITLKIHMTFLFGVLFDYLTVCIYKKWSEDAATTQLSVLANIIGSNTKNENGVILEMFTDNNSSVNVDSESASQSSLDQNPSNNACALVFHNSITGTGPSQLQNAISQLDLGEELINDRSYVFLFFKKSCYFIITLCQ